MGESLSAKLEQVVRFLEWIGKRDEAHAIAVFCNLLDRFELYDSDEWREWAHSQEQGKEKKG